MSEEIDAAMKCVLKPQHRHNWFRLLWELCHHQNLLGQPETMEEPCCKHQDGQQVMAFENCDGTRPPLELMVCKQSHFSVPMQQDSPN